MPNSNIPTQNISQEMFGWEVPVETVPIPSEGKVYQPGTTLHNRQILEIKAMTAQEEDILASRALIQTGTVITHLIQSCLIDKTVDVNEMLVGDRNALMISVRITGYGSDYEAESTCPECSEKSNQNYMLTDLGINRLEINPVQPGANLFEFVLPVTKKVVHFRFLTGKDEEDRSLKAERMKKIMPGMQVENLVTSRLEQTIVSVDGITDRAQISQFVKKLPALDSRKLRAFIDKNEPGIDMSVWMKCPHCSESSQVMLPIGVSFFWPEE